MDERCSTCQFNLEAEIFCIQRIKRRDYVSVGCEKWKKKYKREFISVSKNTMFVGHNFGV